MISVYYSVFVSFHMQLRLLTICFILPQSNYFKTAFGGVQPLTVRVLCVPGTAADTASEPLSEGTGRGETDQHVPEREPDRLAGQGQKTRDRHGRGQTQQGQGKGWGFSGLLSGPE